MKSGEGGRVLFFFFPFLPRPSRNSLIHQNGEPIRMVFSIGRSSDSLRYFERQVSIARNLGERVCSRTRRIYREIRKCDACSAYTFRPALFSSLPLLSLFFFSFQFFPTLVSILISFFSSVRKSRDRANFRLVPENSAGRE